MDGSTPHGGRLIERVLPQNEAEQIISDVGDFQQIKLEESALKDVFNICNGVYSPLEGFADEKDFESILGKAKLSDGTAWPIPIVLDVCSEDAGGIETGNDLLLVDSEENPVAILHVSGTYGFDREKLSESVFGTCDADHPGVARTMAMKDVLVGGELDMVASPKLPFADLTLTPSETRALFAKKGWKTVVGFQTRNVPHVGHEYVQKTALSHVDGLFINPVIGKKKPGDFRDEVILDSYKALIENYYPEDRAALSILHLEMRYAGPKEAIFHAIVRKNFGCTHFIVGRDHAGVGDYYDPFAAHEIFKDFPDLGIEPFFFRSFFYCKRCGGVANEKTCPHSGDDIINFAGTAIRGMLANGEVPSAEMMREEVAKVIIGCEKMFVE